MYQKNYDLFPILSLFLLLYLFLCIRRFSIIYLHFFPQGLTCFLCYAIFAAVLGMFQFGYNTGVINTPQTVIKEFIRECLNSRNGKETDDTDTGPQDFLFAISVSIFAIGGMVGGFSGGYIGNKFGR